MSSTKMIPGNILSAMFFSQVTTSYSGPVPFPVLPKLYPNSVEDFPHCSWNPNILTSQQVTCTMLFFVLASGVLSTLALHKIVCLVSTTSGQPQVISLVDAFPDSSFTPMFKTSGAFPSWKYVCVTMIKYWRQGLALLPTLASNFWAQVIFLPQLPK